jgi:hypothetical protein
MLERLEFCVETEQSEGEYVLLALKNFWNTRTIEGLHKFQAALPVNSQSE